MEEPFHQKNQSLLTIKSWQEIDPRLQVGFTTRRGGVSKRPYDTLNLGLHIPDQPIDVIANREILAKHVQAPLDTWVVGEQSHHTNIKVVDQHDHGTGSISHENTLAGIDGLITKESGLLCTALFADCVPLYFFDPVSKYIGIAHAGWKGTVHQLAQKMVAELINRGTNPTDLLVAIGPCISLANYQVDDHVLQYIDDQYREHTIIDQGNNRYLLDLKQLNVENLLQAGVLRHHIDVTSYCTFADKELFYSYRRDHGETGRMAAYIGFMK